MVISTQHKINYTYIKRISHSKPFRHQNDPLYIGNLWAKAALCNGWEGMKLGGAFIQVEAKKKNRSNLKLMKKSKIITRTARRFDSLL